MTGRGQEVGARRFPMGGAAQRTGNAPGPCNFCTRVCASLGAGRAPAPGKAPAAQAGMQRPHTAKEVIQLLRLL